MIGFRYKVSIHEIARARVMRPNANPTAIASPQCASIHIDMFTATPKAKHVTTLRYVLVYRIHTL